MSESVWEDRSWTSLPHLNGIARADVCVIGLGGSGLSAVHTLLDHGARVIGIDAGQVAGGAAGANGGFLLAGTAHFYHRAVAALGRERARELYRLTVAEIASMHAAMPDIVRPVGSLRIALSQDELDDCENQFTAMLADNLPVQHYSGPEGEGLLIPTDAVFNPLARCRRLAHTALLRGARLYENTAAQGIHPGGVQTQLGRVLCKQVIVAVDGKLDLLLPELVGRVRTARLQMLSTGPTTDISLQRAVYARWGYEYWQQLLDGRIVLGGFRDQECDDEWTHSTEPTDAIQNRLTDFLRAHLKTQAAITHRWAASVAYTTNGLPILESVRPNVWVCGAYNGTGNVIGAICGRIVAASALGVPIDEQELLRSCR
jgi:glycine/D-amino acid oxidase-like deaminating enzyme